MLKEHAFRSRDPVHFLFALVYAFLYKSSIFLPHFVAVLVLGKVSSVFVCEFCARTLGVDCTMECWLVVWSCHCVPFRFFSCACVANPTFEVTGEWRTGPMWVKLQVSTNPSWRKQTPKKRTLYQPKKVSRARYAPRALLLLSIFEASLSFYLHVACICVGSDELLRFLNVMGSSEMPTLIWVVRFLWLAVHAYLMLISLSLFLFYFLFFRFPLLPLPPLPLSLSFLLPLSPSFFPPLHCSNCSGEGSLAPAASDFTCVYVWLWFIAQV